MLKGLFNKELALSFISQKERLSWLEKLTESKASVYDKALDSEYLRTHIGGGNHRLFDGGHDLVGAWDKAQNALQGDSLGEEVVGYANAVWKDITTPKGLPFATISPEQYDQWIELMPGVSREYFYDLLSFDAFEILSTVLGAFGAIFALKRKDQIKLSEILGSMGIISVMSANPIMGIFMAGVTVYSYKKLQLKIDKKSFFKSATLSTFSMTLFSILGFNIILELILVAVLTKLFKTKVLENSELLDIIKLKANTGVSFIKKPL